MKTNYVLIDFENVVPDNLELLNQEWIKVMLFVGKNQTRSPFRTVKAIQKLGSRAEYVEMTGTGHKALDFHIVFYIGRISALDNDACFHIISNDTGFDPLIAHLKQEHNIFADRVSKVEAIPALSQASSMSSSERIDFAQERLIRPNAPRPRTRKTLTSHVTTLFHKTLSEEDVVGVVEGLFKCRFVREEGKRLVYSDEIE